jgi:hypothetical protein
MYHLKSKYYVGPCYHGMPHPRVADGEYGHNVGRIDENILKELPRAAVKDVPSNMGVGHKANIYSQ